MTHNRPPIPHAELLSVTECWKLNVAPEPFPTIAPDAEFALLMMVAGSDSLFDQIGPDAFELAHGVSDDIATLALVDLGEGGSLVAEMRPGRSFPLEHRPGRFTGDPRPLADFLARGLVSFSDKTKIAIGFWGHDTGVFDDFDPQEVTVSRDFRFGSLGAPIPAEALETSPKPDSSFLPALTLTNRETSSALAVAFARAGRTRPVELLFFDTCLNGAVEVFTEVRPFAEVVVASPLLTPGTGWDYADWLGLVRAERPGQARAWAELAVRSFEKTYPQRSSEPALLAAFATDSDFVGALARVVDELAGLESAGVRLLARAARESTALVYEENLDLVQVVRQLRELAESGRLREACQDFLTRFARARVAISRPPPGGEELSGMSVWCPLVGDLRGVSRYYGELEFERLTGWERFLKTPI